MFRSNGSDNSLVMLGVIVFALLFTSQYYSNAGLMHCSHQVPGFLGTIAAEGELDFADATEVSPTEKRADITVFSGVSVHGTYSLDENHTSYAILTSRSSTGVPFYPADAVVYLHVKFEDNAGDRWVATESTEFVLQHEADSFPPNGSWETELANEVTFTHGTETFKLTVANAIVSP